MVLLLLLLALAYLHGLEGAGRNMSWHAKFACRTRELPKL